MIDEPIQTLLDELDRFGAYPVFLTGAGISITSGIPPFRGTPDAVWERDVLEMGTAAFFRRRPVEHWCWYLDCFDTCRTASPNAAHRAVTDIESTLDMKGSRFLCITQNIDGLHRAAGTRTLVEVHGDARRVRCSRRGCENGAPRGSIPWADVAAEIEHFRANPSAENLPRCSTCRKLLRPHVLWFDEFYSDHVDYGFAIAGRATAEMSALVFVGTSLSVGITTSALEVAEARSVPTFLVDPFLEEPPLPWMTLIRGRAEDVLPSVAMYFAGA